MVFGGNGHGSKVYSWMSGDTVPGSYDGAMCLCSSEIYVAFGLDEGDVVT